VRDASNVSNSFTDAIASTMTAAMVWGWYGAVTGAVFAPCAFIITAPLPAFLLSAFLLGACLGGFGGVLAGIVHGVLGGWMGGAVAGLSGGGFAAALSLHLLGVPRFPSPAFWILSMAPVAGLVVGVCLGNAAERRIPLVPFAAVLSDALRESPIGRWSPAARFVLGLTIGLLAVLGALGAVTAGPLD
jgi:hypothetical protein